VGGHCGVLARPPRRSVTHAQLLGVQRQTPPMIRVTSAKNGCLGQGILSPGAATENGRSTWL
jgi:hypothetical protein